MKHRRSRKARRKAGRRRRSNPIGAAPVLLVNPSDMKKPRRRSRRSRRHSNPVRRHRRRTHARRRSNPTRRHRHFRRRRNPAGSWGHAFATFGTGFLGGGLALGADFGASFIPVPAWAHALITGGVGVTGSVAAAMFGLDRLGAGIAGGTGALVLARGIQAVQMMGLGETSKTGPQPDETAAGARRFAPEAARVMAARRGVVEGGRVVSAHDAIEGGASEAGALTSRISTRHLAVRRLTLGGDAGAMYYTRDKMRRFGPKSWAYDLQRGNVRVISAHNTR